MTDTTDNDEPMRDRVAEAIYESRRDRPNAPHWPKALTYIREKYLADADAVLALLSHPSPSTPNTEPVSIEGETTTEYAYGTLDAPDIITPTGEDIDDLGSARYNAEEFWVDALQRTVKRGPWQVVPGDVTPPPALPEDGR